MLSQCAVSVSRTGSSLLVDVVPISPHRQEPSVSHDSFHPPLGHDVLESCGVNFIGHHRS
jgi:hypothetical protein